MGVLRFSVFEIDPSSGELTRAGRRTAIAQQPFTVLFLLASRAGMVVTREELKQALWGDGTHVDFDRSLNFCVAAARRALGDDARRPRFIETVPKRGYRFIADVHGAGSAPPPMDIAAPTAPTAPARSHEEWRMTASRWAMAAALPLLLAQSPAVIRAHTRATTAPQALAAFERGDFERALQIDARFAEAHFGLAVRDIRAAERQGSPTRAALMNARAAVSRAVALEEAPESLRLLGMLRLTSDWDWNGARRDLTRALELAPEWDLGLGAYAEWLSASGDDSGALAALAKAQVLSPACDVLFLQSAIVNYRAGRYDTALNQLARAAALGPSSGAQDRDWQLRIHDVALLVHAQRRDWPAAQREVIAIAQLNPETPAAMRYLRGLPPHEAVQTFLIESTNRARPDALRGRVSNVRLAQLNALTGRTDEALGWLERSLAERETDLVFALRDPAFDALRESARFRHVATLVQGRSARGFFVSIARAMWGVVSGG